MNAFLRAAPFTLILIGCASRGSFPSDSAVLAAANLPESFLVSDQGETRPARPSEGCRSPMVDPRDGTTLTLTRSMDGRGDYEASQPGRYGLAGTDLLRIECATGRPLGRVPG